MSRSGWLATRESNAPRHVVVVEDEGSRAELGAEQPAMRLASGRREQVVES